MQLLVVCSAVSLACMVAPGHVAATPSYPSTSCLDCDEVTEHRRDKRLAETTVALIAAGISAGASLGTGGLAALMTSGFNVEFGLATENYSKYLMHSPDMFINAGLVSTPAINVQPSKREALVAHKTGGGAALQGRREWWRGGSVARATRPWSCGRSPTATTSTATGWASGYVETLSPTPARPCSTRCTTTRRPGSAARSTIIHRTRWSTAIIMLEPKECASREPWELDTEPRAMFLSSQTVLTTWRIPSRKWLIKN